MNVGKHRYENKDLQTKFKEWDEQGRIGEPHEYLGLTPLEYVEWCLEGFFKTKLDGYAVEQIQTH